MALEFTISRQIGTGETSYKKWVEYNLRQIAAAINGGVFSTLDQPFSDMADQVSAAGDDDLWIRSAGVWVPKNPSEVLDQFLPTSADDDFLQRNAGAWANRTPTQMLATLLTAASNDDVIQRKSGAWTYRTIAQLMADMGYETGTFTPAIRYATAGTSSWTYSSQVGAYTTFGNLCFFELLITGANPTKGTGAGNVEIYNLPYTPATGNATFDVNALNSSWVWPASRTMVSARASTSSYFDLSGQGSAVGQTTFAIGNTTNGVGHNVRFGGMYSI